MHENYVSARQRIAALHMVASSAQVGVYCSTQQGQGGGKGKRGMGVGAELSAGLMHGSS